MIRKISYVSAKTFSRLFLLLLLRLPPLFLFFRGSRIIGEIKVVPRFLDAVSIELIQRTESSVSLSRSVFRLFRRCAR